MTNQPFSFANDLIKCAKMRRKEAHEHLAMAKEYKTKHDLVRYYDQMSKFHEDIAAAIARIQYARLCRQDELKWLEAAE